MKKIAPLLAILLTGCAVMRPAPVQETPPPAAPVVETPPVPAGPPSIPQSRLVCDVPVRKVLLADLGLPEGSVPRDVALTRNTVWILFETVLVGMPRQEIKPGGGEFDTLDETEMFYGVKGVPWETVSVSPRDGSIWIASSSANRLWHKPPIGRVRPVPVAQAKEGGFRDLVARWDGVYVVPTACAGASVWRLDLSGKVLANGLPSRDGACPAVDLETDWSGRIWALLPGSGEAFRLNPGDRWVSGGEELAFPGPWPKRAGPFRGWFFWGTEAVGLGGEPGGEEETTLLVRRTGAFQEECGEGNRLLRVVGDSRGWVALTREWLLVGEHAVQSPG